MGKALTLTIGGILTVLLNVLFADRLRAWIPWFTEALLAVAVERLPEAQRERFAEEWASHVNDISTDIGKVLFARGCVSAAREIASFLGDQSQVFGRVLSRSREFLQRVSKRFTNLLGAAGALLLGEDSMLAKRGLAATILVPTLLLGLAGFLVSYAFAPKYVSRSTILLEGQTVPENIVAPIVTEELGARVAILEQRILSESKLKPIIERVYPGTSNEEQFETIDRIRSNMAIAPVDTALTEAPNDEKRVSSPFPGFFVMFTDSSPRQAQQICNELAIGLVDENSRSMAATAAGTNEFLARAIDEARSNLEKLSINLQDMEKQLGAKSSSRNPVEQLLRIEYDLARKRYEDLLAKKAAVDLTVTMNTLALGERMSLLNQADLPESPVFPNRLSFLAFGLSAGLALGTGLALWTKFHKKVKKNVAEQVQVDVV